MDYSSDTLGCWTKDLPFKNGIAWIGPHISIYWVMPILRVGSIPSIESTWWPFTAMSPATAKCKAMQRTAPNNSSNHRGTRSMTGSMMPVVTRKMTYCIAEEYRFVLPLCRVVSSCRA